MGLTILEFPEQDYDYVCEDCGKKASAIMIKMQVVGFECMKCGRQKLDRIINKIKSKGGVK